MAASPDHIMKILEVFPKVISANANNSSGNELNPAKAIPPTKPLINSLLSAIGYSSVQFYIDLFLNFRLRDQVFN